MKGWCINNDCLNKIKKVNADNLKKDSLLKTISYTKEDKRTRDKFNSKVVLNTLQENDNAPINCSRAAIISLIVSQRAKAGKVNRNLKSEPDNQNLRPPMPSMSPALLLPVKPSPTPLGTLILFKDMFF